MAIVVAVLELNITIIATVMAVLELNSTDRGRGGHSSVLGITSKTQPYTHNDRSNHIGSDSVNNDGLRTDCNIASQRAKVEVAQLGMLLTTEQHQSSGICLSLE